jgi:hypothetical protein
MQKLSKFKLLVLIFTFLFFLPTQKTVFAAPKCDEKDDPEFHSLRPYQMKPCGDAVKAKYCSNDLIFTEDFQVKGWGDCVERYSAPGEYDFPCSPMFPVYAHDLYVQLDDSHLPIMGNTEDNFDDAQKVNEYASWYLNGVIDKVENTSPTDDQIVNFSGPVRKLLPYMIQDSQRMKIIKSATETTTYFDDSVGADVTSAENHDQIVVDHERLSDWKGDLSFIRSAINTVGSAIMPYIQNTTVGSAISYVTGGEEAWNKRTPPLPWDDGTDTTGKNPVPFKSQILYQKAYNEWLGKTCAILPIVGLQCLDIKIPTLLGSVDVITNKYASLWHFVPLSNNSDKKGAEFIIGDVPLYIPANGTAIGPVSNGKILVPPLYFSHMQEVKDLSETLNSSYMPKDVKNEPLPTTTEENNCSVAVVRTNKGDDLFPGDPNELLIPDVSYTITAAQCHESIREEMHPCGMHRGTYVPGMCKTLVHNLDCPAEVAVKIRTGTKTPWAKELFQTTVAGSGSTFRKIFPKVQAGAPVSCIANIPTITDVTYDPDIGGKSQEPQGGELSFKVYRYPEDGTGDSPQLTFPHIGSIYEYFLKGIQTALRPKGYGDPITDGLLCNNVKCGELPDLPQASGSCSLGSVSPRVGDIPQSLKDIVSAAAQTYNTPPNLILGIMYGEGLFDGKNKKDWTDENVKNWATCEPVPNCSQEGDDNFMGFNGNDWETVSKAIMPDLKKLDPNKNFADVCNLLDAVYGVAWNLHNSASGNFPFQCFGYNMNAGLPLSCDWKPEQYISAIKIAENGFEPFCFTLEGSCASGGGREAACNKGVDACETKDNRYSNPSHMGCVFDVANGK